LSGTYFATTYLLFITRSPSLPPVFPPAASLLPSVPAAAAAPPAAAASAAVAR